MWECPTYLPYSNLFMLGSTTTPAVAASQEQQRTFFMSIHRSSSHKTLLQKLNDQQWEMLSYVACMHVYSYPYTCSVWAAGPFFAAPLTLIQGFSVLIQAFLWPHRPYNTFIVCNHNTTLCTCVHTFCVVLRCDNNSFFTIDTILEQVSDWIIHRFSG